MRRDSSGSRISAPNAQTTTASGAAAAIRRARLLVVHVLGLRQRRARARAPRSATGGGDEPAPAPARPVRPRHHERRPVRDAGEPLEHGGGELGGAEVDGPRRHAPLRRPARARLAQRRACAALRWSREVRSRISTPSRWSISCWSTRASRPDASIVIGSPCSSCARTRTWIGRSTSTSTPCRRQAALLDRLQLVAGPLDHRVDDRVDGRVRLDAVDEHALQLADLRGRQADPERVLHDPPHLLDLVRSSSSKRSTGARPALQHRIAQLAHEAAAPPGGAQRPRDRAAAPPRLLARASSSATVRVSSAIAARPAGATAGRRPR